MPLLGSQEAGLGSVKTAAGGDGGGGHPGFPDTLAGLYAFGLSDDPELDNTLVGSYFDCYFNEEGGIELRQNHATDGSDFDSHPALLIQRDFSTPGIVGELAEWRQKYSGGSGENTHGGVEQRFILLDENDVENLYDQWQVNIETPLVGANWYDPLLESDDAVVYQRHLMQNRFGGLTSWYVNSDGTTWHQAMLDAVTPYELIAYEMSMQGWNALAPPVEGSSIAFPRITGPANGPSWASTTELGRLRWVLGDYDFGTEEANASLEIYLSNRDDGERRLAFFDGETGETTITGNLNAQQDIDVTQDATIGGDLDVGGAFINGAQVFELDVGEIDPTIVADYTFTLPAGYYVIPSSLRFITTQLNGTLTSAPTGQCGNDSGKVNIAASAATIFGTTANINASTVPFETGATINTLSPAATMVNTSTPFTLRISVGAVLNTATIYRLRAFLSVGMVPV